MISTVHQAVSSAELLDTDFFMTNYKKLIVAILVILLSAASDAMAEQALEWKECVEEARSKHPDLLSAWEKVKQAKAAKEVTRSATVPQISGAASDIRSKTATTHKPSTAYEYSLTGEQLLFDGFKTSYDLSTAERNIIAARYNYDVTSSNVRLRLRTAFANLLNAQELVKVTEEIEARRKQTLELVKLRYEGGREHKGSLMTSEADLAQATYEVGQAKRSVYYSQRQLTKELGRSRFISMTANGSFEVKESDVERPDFEKLAVTNPLLSQLIAQKEAARFGLKSAYAQFYPQIYANATIDNTNTNAFPDKNEYSYGLNLTLPIFDGGNLFANAAKAKATFGQTVEDERSGRDGVILTLSNTWTKLQDAIENVKVQRKFLEATAERARIAQAEYSIGLLSYDNWIIIEDNYVSAKKTYLAAQTNALLTEANWIQAKGGTLDYDT